VIRSAVARARGTGDERGVVLIVAMLVMIGLLGMCALVIDIQQRRVTARHGHSVADLGALAAGPDLGTDAVAACRSAITNINANIKDAAGLDPAAFCSQAGNNDAATPCSGGSSVEAMPLASTGRYTISVHYPVPASEITDSRFAGGAGVNDGLPCQRLRVIVAITDPAYFGRVFGASNSVTTRSAVVKIDTSTPIHTPVLWLLDPTGCVALKASGGTTVNVGASSPTVIPGLITVDSDGSGCSSNTDTIVATGGGTKINALPTTGPDVGAISLHALPGGSTSCVDPACNTSDVSSGRITPQPVPAAQRATRALVDWRYDCKTGYPTYHGISIADCPDAGSTPPYLTNLRTAIGASGQPSGYLRWTTSGYSCNPSGTVDVPAGNWWIDCSTLTIGNNTTVNIAGGNVVIDGTISMTGTSALNVNTANPATTLTASCQPPFVTTPCLTQSSPGAAFVYMRSGDVTMNGGTLTLNHVSFVQQSGYLKLAGGANPNWSAPSEGPFLALSLWSEQSSSQYQINGGAGMALAGIFFTPEASPFSISGGSPVSQQHAQFITYQLAISGGGTLNMAPDPQNFIQIPPTAGVLIR
jgi:hypothetical protein